MNRQCPRIIIAGAASGVGKTSISLGLARAFSRQGLKVQPFKVGPDFLDPTYLTGAADRICLNLDGWMTDRRYVCDLFEWACRDADLAIIEGVMGLFDGADPADLSGSTAEIAIWLNAPIILVVDAHGLARSFAAVVKGFAELDERVKIAGVIANRIGSESHRDWLAQSLAAARLPQLAGAVSRDTLVELPSRHLGLVTANEKTLSEPMIEQISEICRRQIDIQGILDLARNAAGEGDAPAAMPQPVAPAQRNVKIAVAKDEAFHFYYPDNLQALERAGARLIFFSPMHDVSLPQGVHGLYFGGGYPELHAHVLSSNHAMIMSVQRFAETKRPIYAECGGLMYLSRSVQDLAGREHMMAGLLPFGTRMLPRLRTLGYVEISLLADCPVGPAGQNVRGHEFHYSEIVLPHDDDPSMKQVYSLKRRRGGPAGQTEGFCKDNILASYVHLHWASRPAVAEHFVGQCGKFATTEFRYAQDL